MRLLLDTGIILWTATGKSNAEAARYINDTDNVLLFSSASIWEVVIKRNLRRADFTVNPVSLYSGLISAGYEELPVFGKHTLLVGTLPPLHKDPFDRLLLAQAMYEGIPLLTSDKMLAQYSSSVIHIPAMK